MKRVYVAGAYSEDNVIDVLRNIGRGEIVCANLFADGVYPFCPWFDKDFIIKQPEYDFNVEEFYYYSLYDFNVEEFYNYSLAWLEVSDAMFVIEGYEKSKGTLKEIEFAKNKNIPIFYNYIKLLNWCSDN